MADEITAALDFQVEKGSFAFVFNQNITGDLTGSGGGNPGIVTIGTSEEDVSFGDLATAGWVVMRNLDANNYVQWGPKSAGAMVALGKLNPGEFAFFYIDSVSVILRMIANTASCKVLIAAMEV